MPRDRVRNARRLQRTLTRLPEEVTKDLKAVLKESGEKLLHEMRARAPVSNETPEGRGHLRDEIKMSVTQKGLRVRVGLLPKRSRPSEFYWFGVLWARFLEFGRRGKPGKRPFMLPAWLSQRDRTQFKIRRAVRGALQRVVVRRV